MRTAKSFFKTLCAAALIALTAWLVTTGPAQAEPSWTRLRAQDSPAYVTAIVFSSESVLDANNSVCWSKWCVSFGSERPLAEIKGCVPDSCPNIWIMNLLCENPVLGTSKCVMSVTELTELGGWCFVFPESEAYEGDSLSSDYKFQIQCPQHLRLE